VKNLTENAIKERLRELETERKSLLADLAELRSRQDSEEFACSPIGRPADESTPVTPDEKVNLFLKLFACRTDVFPKYWENSKSGKRGYSPVCSNEWVRGVCDKPRVKCSDCPSKAFRLLDADAIFEHLKGKITAGTYAIRTDDTCKFLATDFDKSGWEKDILLFKKEGEKLGIDVLVERSRPGNGGHAWIFFSDFIPAALARQLGSIIMTKAIMRSPRFDLSSYDRFFPNQDYMPKGGFGNLIALPLQRVPRKSGNSVFIDADLKQFEDQWNHLSSIRTLSYLDVSKIVDSVSSTFEKPEVGVEDENQIWSESSLHLLTEDVKDQCLGNQVEVQLSSQLNINIEGLPTKLVAALKRVATFANPEHFQKQKMRFSTWNIPKYIFCGDLEGKSLILPSGLLEKVEEICKDAGAAFKSVDYRPSHKKFRVSFKGKLKKEQKRAVEEVLQHEYGVLVAPPGSGKTVMGCAILAKRKVPTLILVHRAPLLEQECDFDAKRVIVRSSNFKMPEEAGPQPPIHQVWSHLIADQERIDLVTDDIIDSLDESRVPLVISERKEHLQPLRNGLLGKEVPKKHVFILDGDLSKKQRGAVLADIHAAIAAENPICILTTGSLIGEGFDLPALDTLFLTMPVAFRGKVIQYAGRIYRPVEGKSEVRIYDYVDTWSGLTFSMFRKRVKAYRSMGYRIESPPTVNVYGDRSQPSLFRS